MASCSGDGARGHHRFTLNVSETYVSDGANNYSTVSWELILSRISGNWDWRYSATVPVKYKVNIDGNEYTGNIMSYDGVSTVTVDSGSLNIGHNSNGSKSISFSFEVWDNVSANYLPGSASGSGSMDLTTIPRYASITSFSVSKLDETSVKFNWGADASCDWAWYSTDGGNNWNNLPNSNIIGGLSANTWYAFKLRVRRTDSGLTTDSDVVWQQTYDYPHLEYASDFTIGENINVNIYNPLNRWMDIYFIGNDNSTICTASRNNNGGMSIGNTAQEIENQYYSIPNSSSGNYRVRLVVSSLNRDTTVNGARYYARESECKALLSMSVVDTNSDITTLLGSNTKFLKYLSKPQVVLTPTTRYNASIIGQTISLGDGQYYYSLSHTFNTIGSNYVSGTVRDSRGFYTTVDTTLDMVDYIKLAITKFELSKPEGTSDEVKITLEGNWFNDDFVANTPNTLSINLDYKLATSSTWTNYGTLTPTITGNTFKITNLSLGNIYDFDKEYQFRVTITDLVDEISDIEAIRGQEVIAIGDGKIWLYGDVFINDFSLVNQYSTSEVKTCLKWIDGKPIYRKVFMTTSIVESGNTNLFAHNIQNVDKIWIEKAFIYNINNNQSYPLPILYYNNDSTIDKVCVKVDRTNIQFFVETNWPTYWEKYIILEYTKTTD